MSRIRRMYIMSCRTCKKAYKEHNNLDPRCPHCGSQEADHLETEELIEEPEKC